MNGVDIAIISVMVLSVLMGLIRGLTREVLGLLTWAGAAFATYATLPLAAHVARSYIANPMMADGISILILFVIFLICFSVITNVIASSVRDSMLGGLDRSLGFVFGIARGAVFLCLLEVIFTLLTPRDQQPTAIQNARFMYMIRRGGDGLLTVIPQAWLDRIPKPGAAGTAAATIKEEAARQVTEHVAGQVASQLTGQGQKQPQGASTPPAAQPSLQQPLQQPPQRPQKLDPEKAVDSLASLRPQAVEGKRQEGYDARQSRDLDRLLQSSE